MQKLATLTLSECQKRVEYLEKQLEMVGEPDSKESQIVELTKSLSSKDDIKEFVSMLDSMIVTYSSSRHFSELGEDIRSSHMLNYQALREFFTELQKIVE
jgi:hypothetical protein